MSLNTVEAGLQSLFRKVSTVQAQMVALHKKVDPNLTEEFYLDRLRSFTQPQLLIDDILFVFDSFSEKMEQIASEQQQEAIRKEKLDRLLDVGEPILRRYTKTQQPAGKRQESAQRHRGLPNQKRNSESKEQQLKERDLNQLRRSCNTAKTKIIRFEYRKSSPKNKPPTRQSVKNITVTEQNESSPFEDVAIYKGSKGEVEKQQKSITLRGDRSRRNSKIAAITLISNSFKVW